MDIDSKLKKIKKAMDEQNIHLNSPTTIEAVQSVEQKYGITLPEEFVVFITSIGNGGTIPERPNDTATVNILIPLEDCFLKNASIPFPFTNSWYWKYDFEYDSENDQYIDPEGKLEAVGYGNFGIDVLQEEEVSWHLIVEGPCKGEVWLFSDGEICRGENTTFLDWVLSCLIEGYEIHLIDSNPPVYQDTEHYISKITEKIKKRKFVLRPIVAEGKVLEIERNYNIKFPGDYFTFLTEVGDGFYKDTPKLKSLLSFCENNFNNLSIPFPFDESKKISSFRLLGERKEKMDKLLEDAQHGYVNLSVKRGKSIEETTILIVNGASKGEIWCILNYLGSETVCYFRYKNLSFSAWLESYLDDI